MSNYPANRYSLFYDMEDLLECSVCMERYSVSGNRIPRVLPCQHTFCHSCIRNLLAKHRLTCPACRHRDKCTDINTMPRNLTLLRLLEIDFRKAELNEEDNNKYCTDCMRSAVFDCSCCDVNTSLCRQCLIVKLQLGVERLKMQLEQTRELCSTVPKMQMYWTKVHQQSGTILRTSMENVRRRRKNPRANTNENQHFIVVNACVHRFSIFRTECRLFLEKVKKKLRKGDPPCCMSEELASLQKRCDYHTDNIEHARAKAYLDSYKFFGDMINVISKKFGLREIQNSELLWQYWNDHADGTSLCFNYILILLFAWLAISYENESACSPATKKTCNYCLEVDRVQSALLILIFMLVLYGKCLIAMGYACVKNILYPMRIVQKQFERFLRRHNFSASELRQGTEFMSGLDFEVIPS